MKPLTWNQRFGAIRRAKDKAILAECERQICQADLAQIELDVEREERARLRQSNHLDEEMRHRIARALGRPR